MAGDAGHYPCWEFLDCDGEVPQSRSGHTCALHKNRYLYIFGGFDGSNCFDDLYVLDLDARHWRKIEAGGERPSGRASHSAVTDDLAGVMYIFGGSGSHFGYTNKRDLCEFCFETETWRLLSLPADDQPSARYGQSMVAYQKGLYVWGGTHGTNYPTDMHRFDLCSKTWDFVVTSGDLPCGRYRHQAMVRDEVMYIVGGSGINRYGDVFTFNFSTNVWRKLVCTGTDLSDGRYAHSAVLRDGFIYLYGGNDGVRHDDLQQLDLETRVWSRVAVHGQCPPGRDFHAAVLRKDSMVIFGGSNGMRRHNDVFEFHLAPKIPPCTLSGDLEAILEQAQHDEATQCSCDVFLCADNGESSEGVYCHSHLLYVRCLRLYKLVQSHMPSCGSPGLEQHPNQQDRAHSAPTHTGPVADMDCRPATSPGEVGHDQDEAFDSLLRSVVNDDGAATGEGASAMSRASSRRVTWQAPPACGPTRTWAPVDLPHAILWHLVHYLYVETTKFGRLSADELYRLFMAAKFFEVPRLAVLCERQLKVWLGLDNVLPLLRCSAQDGAAALSVQEACKHFFLANFNACMRLGECETLDPKLICEIVREHNDRPSDTCAPPSGIPSQQSFQGVVPAPQTSGRSTDIVRAGEACAERVELPRETLAEDLKRLLIEEIAPDFEVVVQDEVICTHKFVLVARSRYFASCILTSGMVESQDGRLVIHPSTSAMTADAFRAFLRFLYAGDDILHILAPHPAMYLVDASSFYGLTNHRLKHFCELCVKDSFNEAHVLELFEASSRLNVEAVRAMALEFIVTHFHSVCRQPNLELLDKPLLVEILKGVADRLQQPLAAISPSAPPSLG